MAGRFLGEPPEDKEGERDTNDTTAMSLAIQDDAKLSLTRPGLSKLLQQALFPVAVQVFNMKNLLCKQQVTQQVPRGTGSGAIHLAPLTGDSQFRFNHRGL